MEELALGQKWHLPGIIMTIILQSFLQVSSFLKICKAWFTLVMEAEVETEPEATGVTGKCEQTQ